LEAGTTEKLKRSSDALAAADKKGENKGRGKEDRKKGRKGMREGKREGEAENPQKFSKVGDYSSALSSPKPRPRGNSSYHPRLSCHCRNLHFLFE